MVKIMLCGCQGKMGHVIEDCVASREDCRIIAGVDINTADQREFPVYEKPELSAEKPDVVIDYSHPSSLEGLLAYGIQNHVPLVIATTGYHPEQIAKIEEASKQIPVFFSFNMSLGVNLLAELAKKAAQVLGGQFDIEIVEKHHNRKLDAPSGTALMLADAAAEALPYQPEYVYDRQCVRRARGPHEIGISSVRGGGIVGDHEVIFAGRDEIIELRHSAMSREVFASGAVQAARFLASVQDPGLYSMEELVAHLDGTSA